MKVSSKMKEKFKLSVERDTDGKIIEVFFDDEHEVVSYEQLSALTEKLKDSVSTDETNDADFRLTFGTEFQQKVWLELPKIPAGTTITYQEMAERVGSKGAQQAVGQALARNPLPVILPCHRVTRKDGTLGGFMGKDNRQDIKASILEYEKSLTKSY